LGVLIAAVDSPVGAIGVVERSASAADWDGMVDWGVIQAADASRCEQRAGGGDDAAN